MAFGYVSHTTPYNSSSTAAATVNAPAGVADDDLLFTLIKHSANEAPNSVPSGWTLLGQMFNVDSNSMNSLYMKVAASEPASYDWGWATAARTGIVCIAFRDGFDTADPIDAVSNTKYSTSNATVRAASMTVAAANSPIIFFGHVHASATQSFTPPSSPASFTEHVDDWGNGSRGNFCVASMIWTGSGATGDIDATNTLTTADSKHAFAVSLNPASGSAALEGAATASASATGALTIKKAKLRLDISAAGEVVDGIVWANQSGAIAGAEIGEFTGQTIATGAGADAGFAVLKVPVTLFGGGALNVGDTVQMFVRTATKSSDLWPATIIEE